MTALATLADARAVWADAETIPDTTLQRLLDASWAGCEAFLPAGATADLGAVPGPVLERWREANVLDARDIWQAAHRDGDVIAFDAYAVRVRPLSGTVAALLRPRRGRPLVG